MYLDHDSQYIDIIRIEVNIDNQTIAFYLNEKPVETFVNIGCKRLYLLTSNENDICY